MPLIAYSLSPVRNRVRDTVTSLNSMGSSPAELSIVRLTSALPSAGRLAVPAKMTSSIFCERTALGACAPSTQAMASTTFDLPDPFGPTTTVTPGSNWRVVGSANDLKPLRVSDFKNTARATIAAPTPRPREPSPHSGQTPARPTTIWAPRVGADQAHSPRLAPRSSKTTGHRRRIQDFRGPFGEGRSDSFGHGSWCGHH